MRHLNYFNTRFKFSLLFIFLGIVSFFMLVNQGKTTNYMNDDETIEYLQRQLEEQGVPVKGIAVHDGNLVEVTFQSSSMGTEITPEDPLYIHAVQREITLAQQEGLRIDTVQIVILNTAGDRLFWAEFPVKSDIEVLSLIEADETNDQSSELQNIVEGSLELYGLALHSIELSTEKRGQTATLNLVASDIQAANEALPKLMPSLYPFWEDINVNDAFQIAVVRINLLDSNGELLLKYSLDLQLDQENWWMSDDVTSDWFPSPLPEERDSP